MSNADPPRTDWLDLAVLSRDDTDYTDRWGSILDEERVTLPATSALDPHHLRPSFPGGQH